MKQEYCTSTQHPKWFGLAVQALIIMSREDVGSACPSIELAKYLQSEPSLLRRILAVLAKEGFIGTREGRAGGYHLKKPAASIRLVDIYDAFRAGSQLCFGITETAGTHPLGRCMKSVLGEITKEMDESMRAVLSKYTIADIAGQLESEI
ncbi:iron-responsive transcriptional regulator [Paenibacillus konkukensis]|uniref:Iron-responsive transcriptional regulator n=1 Tax=Paenibacillus konkukensis TaxID=2020716 RepID=A0ABY4S258_9BACL|nr:Rrf2 family transcriptional regulator [Paenibacillus konkukensis]UQZ87508.1 iron-responsive transcriptional regulator [Paenibacillus konkukensis]